MPTLNPRINVTLSPSLDALVSQMASLERVSKSMVLRELLETAEPVLREAVALMEAAKGAGAKARANLARDLDTSIKAAEGVSAMMLRDISNQTRDMVAEAEAVRGRRPARRPAPAGPLLAPAPARPGQSGVRRARKDPPSSNRGVK
jgi:hypothetical protein